MTGAFGAAASVLVSVLALLDNVSAQPGFLSLDCGAFDNHTDDNGIEWIPDDGYITTGTKASISSSALAQGRNQILQRLRYFSDTSRKHCYALPVVRGESYIVRPRFYYGNYDGLNSTVAKFDILIGANKVIDAVFENKPDSNTYYEFMARATNSTMDLCFVTNSTSLGNVPFVSTIEIRKLDPDMKGNPSELNKILVKWKRINLGALSEEDIRYPSDPYDRIWKADTALVGIGHNKRISTNSSVSVARTFNLPPSDVMKSGITASSTMLFAFPVTKTAYYHINFYFAELASLGKNTREFVIQFNFTSSNKPHVSMLIDPENDIGGPLTSLQYWFTKPMELTDQTVFLFVPTPNSTLGPILNAAEMFKYIPDLLPESEPDDVAAIREVARHFNLTGWSGDPCLPHTFAWSWITCDVLQIPARIIELKLANQKLNGTIPDCINELTHLTKIYLDNNALTGTVPEFSSLKNLSVLSLQNNNFSCKLVNASLNLCEKSQSHKKHMMVNMIEIAVPCLGILLAGAGFAVFFFSRERRFSRSPRPGISSFTYKDVVDATNNFRKVLGEGSFGPVFYGLLPDGEEIAVKLSSERSNQGHREFTSEVDILSVVHHKNLVSFRGYCEHRSKLILIYEYMQNGTLRDNLDGKICPVLSWKARLAIALDAAQGLEYLHNSCNQQIIHRDVKTTNILLNTAMVAKVSDFGLSKIFDKQGTHITTVVKGTPGYLDPEYHSNSRLSDKSDVFSFGVVLFEIVCGRKPIDPSLPEDEVNLLRWACHELERGNIKGIVDSRMPEYNEQAAWKVLEIAMKCVQQLSESRPNMSTVVSELREAAHYQEEGSSHSM